MTVGLIEKYSFGEIIIQGKKYTDDVIILGKEVKPGWWRKSGHLVRKADIEKVIDFDPELLIIGTGHSGRMSVPDSLHQQLDFITKSYPTKKAIRKYNKVLENGDKKVAAAFHLTC